MDRNTFSKSLVPGLFAFMNSALTRRPAYWNKVSSEKKSKKAFEESAYYAGLGLFVEKPEGEKITYDSFIQGPTKRWVHKTYGLGVRFTEELIEDSQYPDVPTDFKDMSSELGNVAAETQEVIVHDLYNSGFTTALAGDGLTIFNTAHKSLNNSTWSNRASVASSLSATSLKAGLLTFENTLSDRGIQQVQKPEYLLVPPALEYTAIELLKSTHSPEDNSNAVNALQSRSLKLIVDPFLTSSTAWFILGEKNPIITFIRRAVKFEQDGDFDTGDALFKGTFRMSTGVNKPIGIYGNAGA